MAGGATPAPPRLRAPSLEPLFIATLALFGFRLGARSIGDNSMTTAPELAVRQQIGWNCTGNVSLTLNGRHWVTCAAKNKRRTAHAGKVRQKVEGAAITASAVEPGSHLMVEHKALCYRRIERSALIERQGDF